MKILSIVICCLLTGLTFAQEEFVAKAILPNKNMGSCVIVEKMEAIEEGWRGLALTALHVVNESIDPGTLKIWPNVKVEFQNGRTCSSARVLGYDKDNDLAVIQTWIPQDAPVAQLSLDDPSDLLMIAGYPFGENVQSSSGQFMRRFGDDLFSDIPVNPGYSGGGLFKDKKLVGIISGGWFWVEDAAFPRPTTWPLKTCAKDPMFRLLERVKKENNL